MAKQKTWQKGKFINNFKILVILKCKMLRSDG